jgi:hypothetical protein
VFAPSGSASDDSAESAVLGVYGAVSNSNNFFEGSMDDVRIYNRILSAAEVKQLYQLGSAVRR